MSGNIGEKAQKSAAERAEKRAAALRENLKRRKDQSARPKDTDTNKGAHDAKPQDSQ